MIFVGCRHGFYLEHVCVSLRYGVFNCKYRFCLLVIQIHVLILTVWLSYIIITSLLLTDRLIYMITVWLKIMTRWAKNATEFEVRLYISKNRDGSVSKICRVPTPIQSLLDNPMSIIFVIDGKTVKIKSG